MRLRPTFFSALLSATTVASAMPTAVERGVVVQGGLQFQKQIVLNETALCDGSVRLARGSYDVRFESLGGNRVRASFFQGGAKRGEAQGIIVVNSRTQTGPGGGPHAALTFTSLGLGAQSPHEMRKAGGDRLELVVGQGANQILIGLLLPAVKQGIIAVEPAQKR